MNTYKKLNFCRLSVGDLICGQREGDDWVRGHLLDLGPPLKMSVLDEARVSTILNAIPCPKEFTNILEFGVLCEIVEEKMQLAVRMIVKLTNCIIFNPVLIFNVYCCLSN